MTDAPSPVPLPETREEAARLLGPGWAATCEAAYRWMILGRTLDARMQALQRQGRVGFYGAATGQEAVSVGAGLASTPDDWILPGLREQLVALVRGHPLGTYVHHLFADARDPAVGRNMPCHPTARDVHYVSMSSVIGTQITHAVGAAFGMRRRGDPGVALAFFGDGATSANDFHAGLNFAAVYRLPVLFCCTNNQWAISLPVARQSAAPTLAAKASAYGIPGERVDGTDFLATYGALARSLSAVRRGEGPQFLEFVVYRMTAHSSSDDPKRYQPAGWAEEAAAHDPVARLSAWMDGVGLLPAETRAKIASDAEASVRQAILEAEATPIPAAETVTEDVYAPAGSGGRREGS